MTTLLKRNVDFTAQRMTMATTKISMIPKAHGSFRLFPYRTNWNIDVYNLTMAIRLAYAINSYNSHKFRKYIMND